MPMLRRESSLLILALLASAACRNTGARPIDTGTVETTGPVPCEVDEALTIDSAEVTQPWNPHEAQFTVSLSTAASLAIACTLDSDPEEVHLAESTVENTSHTVLMGGLRANASYSCQVAPVCPTTSAGASSLALTTPALGDDGLPATNVTVHEPTAGRDYIAVNHQVDQGGSVQRLLVYDRDGNVRWYAQRADGGNALTYQEASGRFTIAGGWYPGGAWRGRPLAISAFGSGVDFDTGPLVPDGKAAKFHHDGRELPDGRFLTLEEIDVPNGNGGTIDGIRIRILNPATSSVDFDWSSQAAMQSGALTRGSNDGDVYHANWVDLQQVNGQEVVYVSLCFPNQVIAVNVASGTLRWVFGQDGNFTAVDEIGNDLGRDGFPWCQHGLQVDGDRLLVYDNGRPPRPFSRATEYQLDESTMRATMVWEYTEPEWFEQSLGGVDWTQADRVIIAMGHGESFSQTPGDRTTFAEIDPSNNRKLWEMKFGDVRDMSYKVDAVPPCELFGNSKYCAVSARRLETLSSIFTASEPPDGE